MRTLSDPMDQLLLDAKDTTVVQQATAANDTFPAPYGSQADEEELFSGLGGRPVKKPKTMAKGVAPVRRAPQMRGFLPGMGDDLGAWFPRWKGVANTAKPGGGLFKRLGNTPAPTVRPAGGGLHKMLMQQAGFDGLDGVGTSRRLGKRKTNALARVPGQRRVPMNVRSGGGFMPGMGDFADADDMAGLGAAPARLKPRVSKVTGNATAPVRIPAKRQRVSAGFLPGMGDLGLGLTAPSGVMIAMGVLAVYMLMKK